jgi:hypothetical protein
MYPREMSMGDGIHNKQDESSEPAPKRKQLGCIAVLAVLPLAVVISSMCGWPLFKVYLYVSLRPRIQKQIDVPSIRAWGKATALGTNSATRVEPPQWPDCIARLSPYHVEVLENGTVLLYYGGGHSIHGVVIFPDAPGGAQPSLGRADLWFQMADGTYVFCYP